MEISPRIGLGFEHTTFTFQHESSAHLSDTKWAREVSAGALINVLQKGLQYMEVEAHVDKNGCIRRCVLPFSLIGRHLCENDENILPEIIKNSDFHDNSEKRPPSGPLENEIHDTELKNLENSMELNEPEKSKDIKGLNESYLIKEQTKLAEPIGSSVPSKSIEPIDHPGITEKSTPNISGPVGKIEKVILLRGHQESIFIGAWNPVHLDLVATASADATVRIWDLSEKNHVDDLLASVVLNGSPSLSETKDITYISWNNSGNYIAAGSYDGQVRIWNLDGTLKYLFTAHHGPIMGIKWNSKDNVLLTASCDSFVIAWDMLNGTLKHQTTTSPTNNPPHPLQKLSYAPTPTLSAYSTVSSQQKKTSVWNDAPFVQVPKKPIQTINHISSPFGQTTSQHDQANITNKRPDQYPLRIPKQACIPPPPMAGQKYQGYSTQPVQTNASGPYNLPSNAQPNNSYARNNLNTSEQNVTGLNIYTMNAHNPYIPMPITQPSVNPNYSKPFSKPMISPTSSTEQYEPVAKSNQPYGLYVNQTRNLCSQQESSHTSSPQEQNNLMQQSQYSQVQQKSDYMKAQQSNPHTPNSSSEPNAPQGSKYPPGDRSHIPVSLKPIFEGLSSEMERVKQYAPPAFTRQVQDTERRLNILFDHLNNNTTLSSDLLDEMLVLVEAMLAKNYQLALNIHINLITTRMEECGHWMVGVKRLLELIYSFLSYRCQDPYQHKFYIN
ncbi:hypothetical protein PCK2_000745 [Pneumocystis canis]|nr:hypothetical protein PCK2_000745 [Pneumocystis canis]